MLLTGTRKLVREWRERSGAVARDGHSVGETLSMVVKIDRIIAYKYNIDDVLISGYCEF